MIKREQYLRQLREFKDTEFIKVITGVRCSGKTYLLKMFQEELLAHGVAPEQILFITFESLQYAELTNGLELYHYVMKQVDHNQHLYLFFDEIQLVKEWERAINSFRVDLDADIYISGSNSALLSGELATLLTGRTVSITVYPLSFAEYLQFKGITDHFDEAFYAYVTEGGFPAAVLSNPSIHQSVLEGIYNSILLRDVAARGEVRNQYLLTRLASYLLSEIGNPISLSKIAGVLKNEGFSGANSPSLGKYLQLLDNAYLFSAARRFDLRGKSYLRTGSKYYAIDTGLRNATLNKNFRDNFGHQLENVVYVELLRRGFQVDIGQNNGQEVDFVARRQNQVVYYQVTRQLPENSDREVGNLLQLPDNYQKILLTANRMDVGNDRGIQISHVVDWLLANPNA